MISNLKRLGKLIHRLVHATRGSHYMSTLYNVRMARALGVVIGDRCRLLGVNESTFSTEPYLITIGNHVSMTYPHFITHDGAVWLFRDEYPDIELFGRIVVGNNVFIGYGATLLPGAVVGDNSIVAAGALVKGAFPAGVVIGGVPAKVICSTQEYFEKNKVRFTHFRRFGIQGKRERVLAALQEQVTRQSAPPDLSHGQSS